MNLDIAKPKNPIKRKDVYVFPVTSADQIIVDEDANKRLDAKLGELMPKSGGTFTGWVEFAEQMATVFKSGTGGLKIASADNYAYIQTVDRNNGWINNLLQIDTTTGAVVGGELMPKGGGFFTGDISFNAWGGVALNSTNGIAYRLVADEWGQLVIQKYEKGNWVADMLNFGGGAGNEIYQNVGTIASGWNFKNISVVNSDWSSIDSKTNCIRMLRK